VAPHLTWGDDGDNGTPTAKYDVQRASPDCAGMFTTVGSTAATWLDDTSVAAQGTYCYQVVGHYADGDHTSGTTPVLYDTSAPQVQITSPLAGTVGGTVTIRASGSDAGSGLQGGILVSVDGLITPQAPPLSWNTRVTGASGVTYTVRAHAVDRAGNPADDTVQVIVDNAPPASPAVSIIQNPVPGSPTLHWPLIPDAVSYSVTRTSASAATKTFPAPVMPDWTDPDALAPGTYTYVVTATDAAGNTSSSAARAVVVISPSLTAPRAISAASPTNEPPHLSWQPPVSFLVGGWKIYRDGVLLTTLTDPAASSYDDTGLSAQGAHTYSVGAVNGNSSGDMSTTVSVTYDTVAPSLGPATATANPDGSVSVNWPEASDASPGAGLAKYVVTRQTGSSAPSDPSAGSHVCTLVPPGNGCVDSATRNNTLYSYGIFAIDAAGNVAFRSASARAVDTQAPDPVAGLKIVSSDRTYARLGWAIPGLKGADSDLAGYRVLQLSTVDKPPLNPNDGRVVCRNDDPKDNVCDVLNLVTGKKVSFAVYAYDGVPNYSAPEIVTVTPHKTDNTPPHKPTKVTLSHTGLTYTLKWVSPRDPDLSSFRVTLYPKGPAAPKKGKAIVNGRVLHATFTLKPGQIVYVNLFALDVSGNFSRVTKLIVAPDELAGREHKLVKKRATSKKPPARPRKKT
jgi:hypothetical protein